MADLKGNRISKKYYYISTVVPQEIMKLKNQDEYLIIDFRDKKLNNCKYQLYYLDKLLLESKKEINYFTLNPNSDYVCLVDKRLEVIYDIKNKKEVSPKLRGITPSPFFPKIPYYKYYNEGKHCIAEWPSNKVLFETEGFEDISPIDKGFLGGKNDLFFTCEYQHDRTYYYFESNEITCLGSYKFLEEIFGDLDEKMNKIQIIKGLLNYGK